MQLRGAWLEAMEEARRARERLVEPPGQPGLGAAYYQLGELHRLRGELDEAETAYKEANRHGRMPEPGLALLRLAQGEVEAAVASIRRVVQESQAPRLGRGSSPPQPTSCWPPGMSPRPGPRRTSLPRSRPRSARRT